VHAQATEMRNSRNEMASRLTAGDWVAYKSRGDSDQPFWIGKTLRKIEWENQCIWKNDSHGNVTIEGAIISRGGFAINVQWYTQKVLGVPEYIIEDGEDAKLLVQSNKDLILTGFDKNMHQVYGTRARVPRQRLVQSSRIDDFEYSEGTRSTMQTTQGEWYRKEYGNVWRLDERL
jgi:hypothetical protein